MIILHDHPSSDLSHIQAIADLDEGFALFDYVRVEQQDSRAWIGQIVQPNQNISTVGGRLDPTILHGLRLMQHHPDVQSVQSVQVFDILILGQYAAGQLLTPRLRPLPGAVVSRLGVEDTAAIIEIPAVAQHADGSSNVIGELLNADGVALSVDVRKFNYHIMVAGGTGSGKSNLAANLVDQAVKYSKCVIVHDAKPDYGLIDQANTDLRVARIWDRFVPYGLAPHPANNVLHVGFFGHCDPNAVDHVVGFRSCDFNPDMLADLFFFGPLEQNQYEGLASAAHGLRQQGREDYDLDAILAEVVRRSDPNQPVPPQDRIHELTAQTIRRKVGQRRRQYPWLDAVGRPTRGQAEIRRLQSSRLDANRQRCVVRLELETMLAPGRVIIVDYRDMDEASYAAIVSFFLRQSQYLRKRRRGPGVVQLVDEAHRIFDNESRHGGTLAAAFERVMREGRSVDHSIILSLQNASQIPSRVMNNLNTKFVMRQNSKEEADAAMQTMGKEFSMQSMRLGTGHALVGMHESRAIVLAQMAPSPYELMRSERECGDDLATVPANDDEDDLPF